MNEQPHFCVERVHCCVCNGSGKVSRLVFWKRDCSVCDGTGQRQILIGADLSESQKAYVRECSTFRTPMFISTHCPSLAEDGAGVQGVN